MRIVVDLGCRDYGGPDCSEVPLIERFRPDVYFGFDPMLENERAATYGIGNTLIITSRKAAWTRDGKVGFVRDALRSHIDMGAEEIVPCFDFNQWLAALPVTAEIIVKMDIEGAEYPLLHHMHVRGTDGLIAELHVEWHKGGYTNGHGGRDKVPALRCPVFTWEHA